MTKYRIVFSDNAETDLKSVWHYSSVQWGVTRAQDYMDALKQSIYHLIDFPRYGKMLQGKHQHIHYFLCREHYVFYNISSLDIVILAIVSVRMNMVKVLDDRKLI
jgi:plasmid stabilization system protein ParE